MKNITLEIIAEITQDTGERQVIDMTTEGSWYEKNGAYYMTYDESEMSGMAGSRTLLKIKDQVITMNRLGQSHSKMVFDINQAHNSIYHTPYGDFDMKIITKKIDMAIDFQASEGYLDLEYEMILEAMSQSVNKMTIKVRPSYDD